MSNVAAAARDDRGGELLNALKELQALNYTGDGRNDELLDRPGRGRGALRGHTAVVAEKGAHPRSPLDKEDAPATYDALGVDWSQAMSHTSAMDRAHATGLNAARERCFGGAASERPGLPSDGGRLPHTVDDLVHQHNKFLLCVSGRCLLTE
ncbi:hypothetical protein ACHAWF_000625 [Thalassiosira exigua]